MIDVPSASRPSSSSSASSSPSGPEPSLTSQSSISSLNSNTSTKSNNNGAAAVPGNSLSRNNTHYIHNHAFPIGNTISTDYDPDHRSYARHTESSESARPALSKSLSKQNANGSLSEMSAYLSASSSLSGSTQHPGDNDDDDDDDENDSENISNNDNGGASSFRMSPPSSASLEFSEYHGIHDDQAAFISATTAPLTRTSTRSSLNYSASTVSPVLHAQGKSSPLLQAREFTTSQQIVHMNTSEGTLDHPSKPSSSSSSSSSSSAHPTSKRFRFKHYHKPKVTESPRLVFLAQQFINEQDVESLALIARRRGLPPKLRRLAWPLLLANHPYVLSPNICIDSMSQPSSSKDTVPSRRISNEIARYLKKQQLHHKKLANSTLYSSSSTTTASSVASTSAQNPVVPSSTTAPTSPASASFPPSGSTIAAFHPDHGQQAATVSKSPLGLPPITSSTLESTQASTQPETSPISPSNHNNASAEELEAKRSVIIQDAIEEFLRKWGHIVPYDAGMVYTAFALAEWVDPIPANDNAATATSTYHGSRDFSATATPTVFSGVDSVGPASRPTSRPASPAPPAHSLNADSVPLSLQDLEHYSPYTFSEVFGNLMLVVCHTPLDSQPKGTHDTLNQDSSINPNQSQSRASASSSGNNKPRRSPSATNSSTTDRISFFLSAFRDLLPELADHFDEEDVLSGIGGDEWVLYWVKWMGAKVWDKRDRGRIWDMHFGWRPADPAESRSSDMQFGEAVVRTAYKMNFRNMEEDSASPVEEHAAGNNQNSTDGTSTVISSPSMGTVSAQDTMTNLASLSLSSSSSSSTKGSASPSSSSSSLSLNNACEASTSASAEGTSTSTTTPFPTSNNHAPGATHVPALPVAGFNKANLVLNLSQLELELGPDPFWTALGSVASSSAAAPGSSSSLSTASPSTNGSSADTIKPPLNADGDRARNDITFKTQMEPLTEHLFVCLALFKSKISTLLELDQSEIRGLLGKLYRSKDIESVISESGEMWRSWQYAEEVDEDE